jgi:copper chaperone
MSDCKLGADRSGRGSCEDGATAELSIDTEDDMGRTLEFKVTGMGCGGCESKVEGALGALDGVESVKADHETGTVELSVAADTDGNPLIDVPVVASTLEKIGHPME